MEKTLELSQNDGTSNCVGVSQRTKFKPVVIYTIDEKRPRAFVLIHIQPQMNGDIGVYQEVDALTIGN